MENEIFGIGILIAVLLVAVFIVLRTAVKRVGIKKTCCGGGKAAEKREEKILDAEPIWEITLLIPDFCCENCAVRVENAFNRMDGIAAKASYQEKSAVLLLSEEWSEDALRAVVSECGFTVAEMKKKKM